MIFANYKYKEYNNSNVEQWPIQPGEGITQSKAWQIMLQGNWNYCKKLKPYQYKEQLKFGCEIDMVPSCHPYWSYTSALKAEGDLKGHLTNCCQISKNPASMKFYYNDKSVPMIYDLIKRYYKATEMLDNLTWSSYWLNKIKDSLWVKTQMTVHSIFKKYGFKYDADWYLKINTSRSFYTGLALTKEQKDRFKEGLEAIA